MGLSIEEQRNLIRAKNKELELSEKAHIKVKSQRKKKKKESRINTLTYYAKQCQKKQLEEPTFWESLLKQSFDKIGLDYKFQYYVVIDTNTYYVLDFYFPKEKLAIELDGYHHFTKKGKKHDKTRDKTLKSRKGINVVRYTNKQLTDNINAVIEEILYKYIYKTDSFILE